MLDSFLYIVITQAVCLLSLVLLIILITVHIAKKQGFKTKDYIFSIIFLIGIYLFIPFFFLYKGYAIQNPNLIEKSLKLSINPYEKRLCHSFLADIYANDISKQGIKDGNKAIFHKEQALKGEYEKYKGEATLLAFWYSIKGDYNKTIEINTILNSQNSISLMNIYILNDEYEKALESLKNDNISIANFLKADLYRKLGNKEQEKTAFEIAQQTYNKQISKYKNNSEKMKYEENANRYKSVENYKGWLKEKRIEFNFR